MGYAIFIGGRNCLQQGLQSGGCSRSGWQWWSGKRGDFPQKLLTFLLLIWSGFLAQSLGHSALRFSLTKSSLYWASFLFKRKPGFLTEASGPPALAPAVSAASAPGTPQLALSVPTTLTSFRSPDHQPLLWLWVFTSVALSLPLQAPVGPTNLFHSAFRSQREKSSPSAGAHHFPLASVWLCNNLLDLLYLFYLIYFTLFTYLFTLITQQFTWMHIYILTAWLEAKLQEGRLMSIPFAKSLECAWIALPTFSTRGPALHPTAPGLQSCLSMPSPASQAWPAQLSISPTHLTQDRQTHTEEGVLRCALGQSKLYVTFQ